MLSGRAALVTGACSGIGLAVARRFQREGAKVLVTSNDPTRLLGEWNAQQQNCIVGDLSQRADVERIAHGVLERTNGEGVSIAFLNAGVFPAMPMDSPQVLDAWIAVNKVNVEANVLLQQRLVGKMKERKYGRIVFVSSIAGMLGTAIGTGPYSSTKASLIMLAKSAALEYAPFGVTVNCIAPGLIDTNMVKQMPLEHLAAQIPVRRLGLGKDIAHAAMYLCSEDAGFVTGTTMVVDGGSTAKLAMEFS